MSLEISNRRYIGSKRSLLNQIYKPISEIYKNDKYTIADLFAGTGVVSSFFLDKGAKVISNDILKSNYVAYRAWLSRDEFFDERKIKSWITKFNAIDSKNLQNNYFSDIYGDKYFSVNDAKKIGYIRELIEENKQSFSNREYYALLASLMYATDKIANTVGHFEHYLKSKPKDLQFKMDMLNMVYDPNSKCQVFDSDANKLVRKIECDIAYIDPPYNARQYINFYHVLENLIRWEKPNEFEGKSMKFKRDFLKSGYSRSCALELFSDLISNLKCDLIIVSYNNTYSAKSGASNNKIEESDLIDVLKQKGDLKINQFDYKGFNAGKTDFNEHKEKLYVCKVIN